TTADSHTSDGSGTGSFTSSLTGLTASTTYYVRAYATNSAGTSYGNEVSFTTTASAQVPSVTTAAVSNVTETSATCGGNVTSDGGATVTVRGVCWSTSQNPTTTDSHTSDGSGTGSYTSSLTGLTSSTTYYVRAYATNSAGTSYGNEVSFTTTASAQVPSVTTAAVSNVTETSATCGGNVTSDGGATVTARGVCWSTSQNPTTADSHTTDGSGTGSFTSSITGLLANTTYYVRAYATNSVGTTYGNEVSFTTADDVMQDGQPCPDAPTVTDIDNNTYNTVQIGQQCWMKENLRTTHYANGTSIALGSSTSYTTAYRYYPYHNQSIVSTYGYLYNWQAVMGGSSSSSANPSGVRGICPVGWHVPSDAEWTQMTDYVSSQIQYVCGSDSTYVAKALASTTGWNSSPYTCAVGNNQSTNNETGFSAFPAGDFNNGYNYVETYANFWCATEYNDDGAYIRYFSSDFADVYRDYLDKSFGLTVRCVRNENDSSTIQLPTVTTSAATDITANSATCGGNVTSDGGATVTARGVCWSTSQSPTVYDSHTTDGSGTGNFTSSLTGLTVGTTYHVRAYATNSAGTAYGNEVILSLPCLGAATVTDIDNNIYNTVQIGQQCWMKENLRTTRYADGTSIALGNSTSTTTAYRYYPDYNSSNVATYGYLYNWKAVMGNSSSSSANPSGVQGICPTGWHVPSDAEWTQLTNFVSSQSQYVCVCANNYIAKALASTIGWNSSSNTCCAVGYDPSTNNETGFSALPASAYTAPGESSDFGNYSFFWSTTDDSYNAFGRNLYYDDNNMSSSAYEKSFGFSVRCIRDLPTVFTTAASSIQPTSATCGGNVTSDGGATVTARGVCWSTSQNPTIEDSHTIDGNGTGIFTSNITNLSPATQYYVRAYATNIWGTAYGNEVSFITTSQPCQGAATVTDIDNNTYNTVQIGNQCWMKENLRTTRYANGTSIALGSSSSTTTAYRYYPDNSSSNVATYGYLYNWKAVMGNSPSSSANPSGVQGICPTGWHVPSDAEWTQLVDYVSGSISQYQYMCGSDTTYIAKALASSIGWSAGYRTCDVGSNPSANNATGFSAFPAGHYIGDFYPMFGMGAYFWSATKLIDYDNDSDLWVYVLTYSSAEVLRTSYFQDYGLSVRCVQNEDGSSTAQSPTVTTSTASNITENSVSCGGNVISDGGATVTARGVCWSTSHNPTVSNSYTTDGSGTGSFTSNLTGLTANTTYYVRAYATNSVGTTYGNEVSFTTLSNGGTSQDGLPCPGMPTLTDIDGNIYNTVQLGNQCWMADNLRTTRYADNTIISQGSSASTTEAYWYYPNNDASNMPTYGLLYNWKAVMHNATSSSANPSGVQGICPTGWHLPSDTEWVQLTTYVSSQSQYVCGNDNTQIAKALASTTGWNSSSGICDVGYTPSDNNATNFNAPPAGVRTYSFFDKGRSVNFWKSTEYNSNNAYSVGIALNVANIVNSNNPKTYGFSVRCVRDESGSTTTQMPTVTTSAASNITANSATCGGNVTSDGGATVTARGVCWSTSQSPTVNDSHTTDGSGTGSFTSNLTGLTANTTYYVRAYATNSVGTTYGNEVSFTTLSSGGTSQDGQPCPGMPTLTDIDGNMYNTVQIGNQCWMKENLRTTKLPNGTAITFAEESCSNSTKYRYYPNNDTNNVATYGYLYNWAAVMNGASSSTANPSGVQGVCPDGWHVPSNAEWTQLTTYVSSQSQYVCGSDTTYIAKALASTTGWDNCFSACTIGNNPNANNATGFSALPAGMNYGSFFQCYYGDLGTTSDIWSSTESGSFSAYRVHFSEGYAYVIRNGFYKDSGLSVRCVRNECDSSTAQLPTVTTSAASNITANSATCGGNVTSDGGATVTARGMCWSTTHNPTVSNSHTTDGSGTGSFTSSLTGLTASTTYYARAYATNSTGTAYGSEESFTTTASAQLPSVTTTAVNNVTATSATCGGTVTSDGGANVIARGVCWAHNHIPDHYTSDGSGTGSFTSSLTGLAAHDTYYVRAYATNSVGTAYGNEVAFTTLSNSQDGQPCQGADTLTDIDGNIYNTVQLGNQCWMKENLKTTKYADGTSISQGSSTSSSDVTGYWYYPNNDASNKPTYGLLYNWKAVMGNSFSSSTNPSGVQGICPTGWHVPSGPEWAQLTNYVRHQSQWVCGNSNNYIAKALAGTTGWNSSTNTCAVGNTPSSNNATGFKALPAGSYDGSSYNNFGLNANFCCATQYNSVCVNHFVLKYNNAYVDNSYYYKSTGYSVRCLRDESGSTTAQLPTVITSAASNITANSAICGGNVTSDGGATVTERGMCWNTLQHPTTADSHTSDGSGTGSSTSSLTGLTANTTYYVRAYATNSTGTTYGNEVSFTTLSSGGSSQDGQPPCPGAATLTDIDGNIYNTVQLGNQCWMKENLKTTKYADGTSISQGSSTSSSDVTGYWYYPNNDASNKPTYGLLYNWKAVMGNSSSSSTNTSGVQGICPTGWHVPSGPEWAQLISWVSSSQSQWVCGSYSYYIAKAMAGTTGWNSSTNTCAVGNTPSNNNATGFSALPAGHYDGSYYESGINAFFWSSNQNSDVTQLFLQYNNATVNTLHLDKSTGHSVRCLRD
ncbi:MAG: FISUMP domain-containing protein, partial [Bacteroidales bacterium]|nr:FISUMP domain-containing protein [Bacteroidales bacterium]